MLVSHFCVLNHLERVGGGPTPLHLARASQVPKTTMTHTLAGLEAMGLVETRPNPLDGRSKRVWITPRSREMRAGAVAALGPDAARLRGRLPTARIAALLPALVELRRVLDEDRDGHPSGRVGSVREAPHEGQHLGDRTPLGDL